MSTIFIFLVTGPNEKRPFEDWTDPESDITFAGGSMTLTWRRSGQSVNADSYESSWVTDTDELVDYAHKVIMSELLTQYRSLEDIDIIEAVESLLTEIQRVIVTDGTSWQWRRSAASFQEIDEWMSVSLLDEQLT